MNKRIIRVLFATMMCFAVVASAAMALEPSTPFVITGYVSDSDGNPCNGTWVQVTNTNTSVSWDAENDSTSNYYKLVLDSDDVSIDNILRFEASGCSESKIVEHTVTQSELEGGGMIDFDIVFDAPQEIIWQGDVTLINGTTFDITAHNSGVSYEIDRTTALGALDAAAEEGVFNYTMNDEWYELYGSLFVDSIADIPNEGYNGWMYWVNYPDDSMPMVGADQFVLEDEDVVTWYWSSSMEMTPADSPMLVKINVAIEEPQEIIWQGDVTLINGTTFNVTAHNSGDSYEINRTTALGALDAAAEAGEFNYMVNDEWYATWGSLFVDSIADIPNEGWEGWMYWVNYPADPMPMVGADRYTLEDGDVVTWYWSSSMETTPEDSSMLVKINVAVESGPDLTVTAIETPARLRADVVNPITAVVENLGSADATSFDVTLEADGTVVDTVSIASLNATENTTVELLWAPTAIGNCTLNVTADANGAIEESDETNNSLTEDVTVLEKLTSTVNVRIEGQGDTVWTGTVTFSNSTVTTTDGVTHYLNEPTALGALDEADKLGGFGYVLVDYGWGLYVEEVAGEPPIGWDGWMYRVDYNSPWVGAPDFVLNLTTPPATPHEDVLWYFGAWTAPPLKIELEKTVVNVSEDFIATVTAYNDTSAMFDPVDNATVFVDGLTFQTGPDGNATLSIETTGDYTVYADKGTWADYTRSEKKTVTVAEDYIESYGESVYYKKNVRLAWRALEEPDNKGAILTRKARIAIELEETVPGCKNVSVWVRKLGVRKVKFDVYVSSDGTDWTKIGSETCKFGWWKRYDFSGEFGDVQYIAIKKQGTWWKPRIMGLDAVYAKN